LHLVALVFIVSIAMHISALLYDHLYNTVFAELNCEDERAVGSSYADFGATIDGNCRNGVNMNFHEGEI